LRVQDAFSDLPFPSHYMIEDMLFPAGAADANGLSGRSSISVLQLGVYPLKNYRR